MDIDGRGSELPGGGQYGVIMEDGGVPLDQYLAEHALSYVERVRLAVGLSEAVEELHRLDTCAPRPEAEQRACGRVDGGASV